MVELYMILHWKPLDIYVWLNYVIIFSQIDNWSGAFLHILQFFLRDSCIIYLGNFYNSRHVFMNLSTIVHVASLPKKFRRCEYAFNVGFCDLVFQRKITPRCDLPKLADVLFPYSQAMEDQIITEFENSTFPGEIGD